VVLGFVVEDHRVKGSLAIAVRWEGDGDQEEGRTEVVEEAWEGWRADFRNWADEPGTEE